MAKGINREPDSRRGGVVIDFPAPPKPGSQVQIEGVIYCIEHGEVHDDTLNPYGEGFDSCLANVAGPVILRGYNPHRPVYYRVRKGDM